MVEHLAIMEGIGDDIARLRALLESSEGRLARAIENARAELHGQAELPAPVGAATETNPLDVDKLRVLVADLKGGCDPVHAKKDRLHTPSAAAPGRRVTARITGQLELDLEDIGED